MSEATAPVDPRVAQSRDAIHRAVIALLAHEGVEAVTHARVAEVAGVARATVYRHYADRETLLGQALRATAPVAIEVTPSGDVLADLRDLLGRVEERMRAAPIADLVLLAGRARRDPALVAASRHVMPGAALPTGPPRLADAPAVPLLRAGIADGTLRPDLDVERAAATLIGPVFAVVALDVAAVTDVAPDLFERVVALWHEGAAPLDGRVPPVPQGVAAIDVELVDPAVGMSAAADPRVVRTRARVREAVLSLLAHEGLEAATHARVAERAGVGRATVYRHFPDREALLVDALTASAPRPLRVSPDVDALAALLGFLKGVAAHVTGHGLLPELVALVHRAKEVPELAVARRHVAPLSQSPLAEVLGALVADGRLRPDLDVDAATVMLLGPLVALATLDLAPVDDALVEGLVADWLRGAGPR